MYIVVDGDAVAYKAACAVQTKKWKHFFVQDSPEAFTIYPSGTREKDIHRQPGDLLVREETVEEVSHALQIAKSLMTKIQTWARTKGELSETIVYLSPQDKSDFRYQVATTKPYKGTRTQERPVHLTAVRDYLVSKYDAIVCEDMEADDAVAIEMRTSESVAEHCIAIHVDKDLNQIPGHHYNFGTEEEYTVTHLDGFKHFCMQHLTGDTSDNIPGLPKVGGVTAEKLLAGQATLDGLHRAVKMAYKSRGFSDEYHLEQGTLTYLKRKHDSSYTGLIEDIIDEIKPL